jgi:predicted GIY-YIG superfamily endonuclease
MTHYCYILSNDDGYTYVGYTINPERRIRQHNGEIIGGAKATKGKGKWKFICLLSGFVNNHQALSCEWRIKHPTGKKQKPKEYNGIIGRIKSLNYIFKEWFLEHIVECNIILFLQEDLHQYINNLPLNVTLQVL